MKFIYPLLKILSATLKGDRTVRPFIVVLLSSGSPFAILGRVAQVIILAIKRVLVRWATPHVSQKVFKAIPSVTHFDSTFAIIRIALVTRIITSTAYGLPNRIFRDFMGQSVFAGSCPKCDLTQTPAIRTVARDQIFATNGSPLTTFAVAEPHLPMIARVSQMAHYKQRAKASVNQAFSPRTRFAERNSFDIFNVSQDGFASFAKSLRLGLVNRFRDLSACSYFITSQPVIQSNFLGLNPSVETAY